MKRKTLSLIAIMASMLITGCGNDNTSSSNKNNKKRISEKQFFFK